MLVVTRNDKSLRAPVRALLESADRPDGFFINIHDRPGPYMVGRETLRIAGHRHVRERALGPTFLISPTAFFQTNVGAAGELIRLVTAAVGPARHVLDLYSGSGLFAIPLAVRGARVVAVEENQQAMEDALADLRANRVPEGRVRLMRGRVEDRIARLSRERFDAAVLDPPRQGCAPVVLETVFDRLAPRRAVYVSCNPEALAGELPRIRTAGYRITSIQGVDMFPHTEHVEVVVELGRL
jgi:23S rRNA (uracil1939-C5)-methyltransferase